MERTAVVFDLISNDFISNISTFLNSHWNSLHSKMIYVLVIVIDILFDPRYQWENSSVNIWNIWFESVDRRDDADQLLGV